MSPQPPLSTPWTHLVGPEHCLPEYPRPRLARPRWLNLNGSWEYTSRTGAGPVRRGEHVLVPYPPESMLSGIGRHDDEMWYRRTFDVPGDWFGGRVLLHFGAVDQIATVWVNNQRLAGHEGGYPAFSVDVTDALRPEGEQELLVKAEDLGNRATFPVGKQAERPGGILYTGASGIWQTVWLEPVPEVHVTDMELRTDLAGFGATVSVSVGDAGHPAVDVAVRTPGGEPAGHGTGRAGEEFRVDVSEARPWSPDDPYLYDLTVRVRTGGSEVVDEVESYVGLRTIGLVDDERGRPRIALNGEITFLQALLDQGYWPDGIYTAPTDEALRHDLERTKALGFNSVRKHVKTEPARWYHWADRLGLLVWQDMPSLPVVLDNPPGPQAPPVMRARERFEAELAALVAQLRGTTSLIGWVPFNEGWGEYDTARIAAEVKAADPDRLVIAASGVNCCHSHPDSGAGDVYDDHTYVGPGTPKVHDRRAILDGEYGGIGLVVEGHRCPGPPQAYELVGDADELTRRFVEVSHELERLVREHGLSGAVYTQTTDVENEVNGLLTYDRRLVKVTEHVVAERNKAVLAAARW